MIDSCQWLDRPVVAAEVATNTIQRQKQQVPDRQPGGQWLVSMVTSNLGTATFR
jgi:hypothetical protein